MDQQHSGLERLLDRWMNDASFRDAFQDNPEEAVRNGNFDLAADELQTLQAANWNLSDGALAGRVNKPRIRSGG